MVRLLQAVLEMSHESCCAQYDARVVRTRLSESIFMSGEGPRLEVETSRFLADELCVVRRLVGTHLGREHDEPGAFAVRLSVELTHSYLTVAIQPDAAARETVEALASDGSQHRIDQAFIDGHRPQSCRSPWFISSTLNLPDRTTGRSAYAESANVFPPWSAVPPAISKSRPPSEPPRDREGGLEKNDVLNPDGYGFFEQS